MYKSIFFIAVGVVYDCLKISTKIYIVIVIFIVNWMI